VHFGKTLVSYEPRSDGTLEAHFQDGSSTIGDVLVGADGSRSNVRKQLLPSLHVQDLHIAAIGGKFRLADASPRDVLRDMLERMTIVLPPAGCGLFVTGFRHRAAQPRVDESDSGTAGLLAPDMEDHIFWALIASQTTFGDLSTRSAEALQDVALRTIHGWHPHLRRLVAGSAEESMTTINLHSMSSVPAWPTSNVTLLGDAIHTMTPLQGLGGNTALRDAQLLCKQLVQVQQKQIGLIAALGAYEVEMRHYALAAVRRSLQYTEQFVSDNLLARGAFKTVLRVVDHFPAVKQRMFAS
jgi:2-polyprenyl-6-methoxyphenol hydroxylase-like FAD-dependent oxidoreductase